MDFLKKLFNAKKEKTGIVFIIEDNPVYAGTLRSFIQSGFPQIKEIKIFPVGETALPELNKNPDLVIIDYFLDAKYHDAETGLEIIKKIREEKPNMNILVLSSQSDIEVVVEAVKKYNCSYVKKDADAFDRVEEIVKEIV